MTDALIYSVTHVNGGGAMEGDTLWHALNAWASIASPEDRYREYQQKFTLLQNRHNADPYALSAPANAERIALLGALIDNLIELLRNGTLVAKGFHAGSLELVEIPAAWWTNVLCNVEENWAESGGVRITGVLVYHPKAKPWRCDSAKRAVPIETVRERMEEMYAEAKREGRRLTGEAVIKNVQLPPGEGGLGCDRRIARTAHSTLPDGVKNPVGAPKRIGPNNSAR